MRLIEKETTEREYELPGKDTIIEQGTNAIIEHDGRRLLLIDGFGGVDFIAGASLRWRFGSSAYQLKPADTLQTLRPLLSAITNNLDPARPRLLWTGSDIEAIAKKLNL